MVRDIHSDEAIPFATLQFNKSGFGKLTDSSGKFNFSLNKWLGDTLIITYAGFETKKIKLDTSLILIDLTILLERGKPVNEVLVKTKFNRGLMLWKKIVRNKNTNNPARFQNYSYELYNKLQVDINNFNREKYEKGSLPPKPLKFILNNIDTTTEEKPILPLYLTETISDFYYQSDPKKSKEIVKANKTLGIENQSFSKFLGGMYLNLNVYDNFISIFNLEFASPISDNGDYYYNYRVPDTQYIGGKRFFHLTFQPKRKGENTFLGDAWIEDSSFAIQKMNLLISPDANVNFIEKLSLVQEFQKIDQVTWFPVKNKFIANFYLVNKDNLNFIGRKTATYKNIVLNDSKTQQLLDAEKLKETIVLPTDAKKPDSFWIANRHEELNTNEKKIYATLDTIMKLPAFKKWLETIYFFALGYKNIGNYEIGPWFNWITANRYEGFRTRFDLGTNTKFSKKVFLHGYLAYGFNDKKMKGMFETKYMFSRNPRSYLHFTFKDDIDYGQTYYDEVSYDNIFALAIRKNNVPLKLIKIQSFELDYFKEWRNGLSITTSLNRKEFNPLINLPGKEYFTTNLGTHPFRTFEGTIKLRFAYLEKYLESSFNRVVLGSKYPVAEIRYTKAFPGVFGSTVNYSRLGFNVSDNAKLPPFGSIYWNVFAGQTFGTAPYMFLNIAPGNEIYFYNKYAFNLMNRYQFISDKYVGFLFEHTIGNGLFQLIPPARTFKLRQFWNVKYLAGSLSEKNQQLNFVTGHPFSKLDSGPYIEAGTGVENIFRFIRLDLIWRLSPKPFPKEGNQKFGVFGSFKINF